MALDPENISAEMDISNNQNDLEEEDSPKKIEEGEVEDAPEEKPEVKQRVKALKKIQVEITKIEACFYEEMHALECKYLPKYLPFFEKRRKIVLGEYEPTVEECDFVGGSDSEVENDTEKGSKGEPVESNDAATEKVSGIPDFWLTIIRNVEMLQELTEDHDVPILKHLTDITVEMMEKPMGFTLLFHFSPNEYFTNPILTKTYEMNCEVDEDDPFQFEGPEIIRCNGCPIDWAKGKNVTVKTIKKKQKHKQNNTHRIVSKTVNAPSFFNFFNPPELNTELPLDEEIQMRLTNDFEIGQYIRERIVPRAVLYYTGEALEEDYEEEEEEEAEEEEDNEDGEGDEESRVPQVDSRSRATRNFGRKNLSSGHKNPDCNQQ
jgi:nucleosome assembly protein 1-like 1